MMARSRNGKGCRVVADDHEAYLVGESVCLGVVIGQRPDQLRLVRRSVWNDEGLCAPCLDVQDEFPRVWQATCGYQNR